MGDTIVTEPYIFAVCGYKNTGKTTLITKLIPVLARHGYKAAVIKHDGHDFEPDVRLSNNSYMISLMYGLFSIADIF